MPPDLIERIVWIFKGNEYVWRLKDRVQLQGTFTIDPSKTPRHIDLISQLDKNVYAGIYELKGDTLRIRFHDATEPRPTAFTTRTGASDHFLIELKRVGPP